MKSKRRTIFVYILVFVVFACLPVIPIRMAPVIPNPVYRLAFTSLLGMIWRLGMVGVSYRWEWYTGAAIIALIAVGLVTSIYVSKR